jgi:signal transduction histidine kinase
LVKDITERMAEIRRDFAREVESILAEQETERAAARFDERLLQSWPLADVGFAVGLDGKIHSPSLLGRAEGRRFRLENDKFLSNSESVEFYWNSPKGAVNLSKMDANNLALNTSIQNRQVYPQKQGGGDYNKPFSNVAVSEAEFRGLVADGSEGTLARYVQNKLKLLVWYRSPSAENIVLGAQLNLEKVLEAIRPVIQVESAVDKDICVALLDDTGAPMALTAPAFEAKWNEPFVSTEVGEILPHWEVAVYLFNPKAIVRSAESLTMVLGSMVALLLMAIGMGGWLIVQDFKRELRLARQKTDFVSNVSHELKTPLTSIRMFTELLAEGRVEEPEKQRQYLKIIGAETARLTRLINNVLDFARMERGERKYEFHLCNLAEIAREIVESYRPQLEQHGFSVNGKIEGEAFVDGDCDSLKQVLLNLISNAEKYSRERKELEVNLKREAEFVEVEVSDRGIGIPKGAEEKIFAKFYRAHDALSSGVQGSGLGLTLARQIARAHDGEVRFRRRQGGGSTFTLRLPQAKQEDAGSE